MALVTPTTRERRVNRVMRRFLFATLSITVIALGVRLLQARFPSSALGSFLHGMELGLLVTLPVGMGALLFRAYLQMDEYGKRVQERAAALGFLLSMVATMVLYAVQSLAGVSLPLWTVYVFGMLVYSASVLLQRRT